MEALKKLWCGLDDKWVLWCPWKMAGYSLCLDTSKENCANCDNAKKMHRYKRTAEGHEE